MEKRLFLAFALSLIFFIGYSHFTSKYFPSSQASQEIEKREIKDIKDVEVADQKEDGLEKLTFGSPDESLDLPQCLVGNYVITYSLTGGYIKTISLGDESSKLPFQNLGFLPEDKQVQFTPSIGEERIVFRGPGGRKKEFVFEDYRLKIKITPSPSTPLVVFSNFLQPSMLDNRYQEIFYAQEDNIVRFGPAKAKEGVYDNVNFAGARDRYYCLSLLKGSYTIRLEKDKKLVNFFLLSPPSEIQLYLGPQIEKILKEFGLQKVAYYGFFHPIGAVMIKLLYFFYFLTKSWGLSIIGFAIFIYFVLFPFTMKSTKAMQKVQRVQPEIEELKKKYKENPQKLQKETIELYRKYKINPLGGCLPLFFQFPIFIALYQVLFRFVELKGSSFLWIKDLSLPDRLFALPFTIPILNIKDFNLLPILIMIVGLTQQRITVSSSTAPEQKKIGLFFSVFIGVIFYNFPSALVLYWFIQNLLTLTYQYRIAKNPQI